MRSGSKNSAASWQKSKQSNTQQHCSCLAIGVPHGAAPLGCLPQSGGALATPAATHMPPVPEPAASLLTESQQRANCNMTKALHASTHAATLKAVRLSLKAACVHIQQAVSNTATADSNIDRLVATLCPCEMHHLVLILWLKSCAPFLADQILRSIAWCPSPSPQVANHSEFSVV